MYLALQCTEIGTLSLYSFCGLHFINSVANFPFQNADLESPALIFDTWDVLGERGTGFGCANGWASASFQQPTRIDGLYSEDARVHATTKPNEVKKD